MPNTLSSLRFAQGYLQRWTHLIVTTAVTTLDGLPSCV